jgi:hypothetical protein
MSHSRLWNGVAFGIFNIRPLPKDVYLARRETSRTAAGQFFVNRVAATWQVSQKGAAEAGSKATPKFRPPEILKDKLWRVK